MKALKKPTVSAEDSYRACLSGVLKVGLKARIQNFEEYYLEAAEQYLGFAGKSLLYTFEKFDGADDDVVFSEVTKGELKSFYTYYMVDESKPGRDIYLKIKNSAAICPICGFGHVYTLDHYLPQ